MFQDLELTGRFDSLFDMDIFLSDANWEFQEPNNFFDLNNDCLIDASFDFIGDGKFFLRGFHSMCC